VRDDGNEAGRAPDDERFVSEVLMVFDFFHFMWVFLMEVVSMFSNINLLRTTL
jgi:hypothetical protein